MTTALVALSVLFFLLAGYPPQRMSVLWHWWGVAALIAALWLVGGVSKLVL